MVFTRNSILTIVLSCGMVFSQGLHANPTGAEVVTGQARIEQVNRLLQINQSSNRAIINWQGFSIAPGETTKFIQPNSNSATLNRVTGGEPSALYGTLQANGKVFLINPNGIVVGPNGLINTQSFIASTLDVSNAEFFKRW